MLTFESVQSLGTASIVDKLVVRYTDGGFGLSGYKKGREMLSRFAGPPLPEGEAPVRRARCSAHPQRRHRHPGDRAARGM
jgi:hypothetical protein